MVSKVVNIIVLGLFISIFTYSGLSTAQDSETRCIERSADIDQDIFPASARLIIHNIESGSIELYNNEFSIESVIDITSENNNVVLLPNGYQIIFMMESQISLINLETFEMSVLEGAELDEILSVVSQTETTIRIPYLDDEYFDYSDEVFSLENLTPPNLINPIIFTDDRRPIIEYFARVKYSPDGRYAAYRSYRTPDVDSGVVLRVENIDTGHTYIVEDDIWSSGYSYYWNNSSDQFYLQDDSHFAVYKAETGNIIFESKPIISELGLTDPTSILQSNDANKLVVSYLPDSFQIADLQTLHFYDIENGIKLPYCLLLKNNSYHASGMLSGRYVWSPNDRYIWWLEETNEDRLIYNLVIFDIQTLDYGIVAENVGYLTRIGFIGG